MTDVTSDLNQVITSAVQARIEAEVAAALSGSDLMAQYVSAALNQTIEVGDRYRSTKITYLRHTIDEAIRGATKAAVAKVIAEELPAIEQAVTTELRKNVKVIAKTLTGKVGELAESAYGIKVEMQYASRD